MTTLYNVPAKELINEVSKKLKQDKIITIPKENIYSRTGVHKENPPENSDWWPYRCASILRKIYIKNGIGVEHLRKEYGGKRDRGSKPNKARKGSGTIVRRALQQLEAAGYVKKVKGKGRILTPKGQSFMDKTAYDVLKQIELTYPELKKY
jgi:small subunit ribosomal protein S19e